MNALINKTQALAKTLAVVAACAAITVPLQGKDALADDFPHGKNIEIIISNSAGGGYDAYARAVARHISQYLPGHPTIVPKNMPGAGGITAANYLYSVAPKDGTVIGALGNTVPFEPIYRPNVAKFDATTFNWLGSPNAEVGLLIAWHTSPIQSFEDAKTREMIVGATGAASTPAFYGRLLNDIFGTKMRILPGYPGQNEAFMAMERGEIEGFPSTFWSSLKAIRPDWIKEKKVSLLIQYALEPHPELKDVPFALDMVREPDKKRLLESAVAPLTLGRPFVAPPGVPAEQVTVLRKAMLETFKDAGFIADCEKQRLETGNILSGEQMEEIIKGVYSMPKSVTDRLVEIYKIGREEEIREKRGAN